MTKNRMRTVKDLKPGNEVIRIFPGLNSPGRVLEIHPRTITVELQVEDVGVVKEFHRDTGIDILGEEYGRIAVPHDVRYDPTVNGRPRYTCFTCKAAAVVRQLYMNDEKWAEKQHEFFKQHPAILESN